MESKGLWCPRAITEISWGRLSLKIKKPPQLVISEPDIEMALKHLRGLPFRNNLPFAWDRQRLLGLIREAAGVRPKVDQLLEIAPGVFGIIKPFGVDLSGCSEAERRLQVWLAVRYVRTNPEQIAGL